MKYVLVAIVLLSFFSFGQKNEKDTAMISFYFGAGVNVPLSLSNKNDVIPHEAFATERKSGGMYQVALGYRFSKKWSTFVEFRQSHLWLRETDYVNRLESLYAESYVYHDFNVDATNSSGLGLRFNSYCIRQFMYLEYGKLKISPSLGLGIRYVGTRDFKYTLRPINSNVVYFYAVAFKKKVEFNVSPEIAFSYNDWSISFYLGTEFGQVTMPYKLQISDETKEIIHQESNSLQLRYLPLYFGFRLELFNAYPK